MAGDTGRVAAVVSRIQGGCMPEIYRDPEIGRMAFITFPAGHQVTGNLACRRGAVVTARTARGHGAVVESRRNPGMGGVAIITAVATLEVPRRFAGGSGAVMAIGAGTNNRVVAHPRQWFPELIRMTVLTEREYPDMILG